MTNINLLPWRIQYTNQQNYILGAICTFIGIIIIILVILGNYFFNMVLDNKAKNIDYIKAETEIYKIKNKEINGLKERKKMLLSRLEIINSLQVQRSEVVNVLEKIAATIPAGIILKNVVKKEGLLNISGKSESNSRISILMINLEQSPLFISPILKEIKSNEENKLDSAVSFEIEVNIRR